MADLSRAATTIPEVRRGESVAAPGRLRRLLWRPETLVLLAILIGTALRFADLGGVPPALNQDEAVNGVDAYSLLLTGRDHLGHPFPFAGLEGFGDWVSPLLTFLTVPAVGLAGLRVEVLRGVSAALGVLAIVFVYLLGTELFGRRSVGVVAAGLLAISPFAVLLSRWAIPPATVPAMVALTGWLFVRAVHRGSDAGLVAVAIAAGLTVAGYPTMKLYVPLLGLAAVVIYGPRLLRLGWRPLAVAAATFAVLTFPIYYLSTADPGGRARFAQISVFGAHDVGPGLLLRQYFGYFSPRYLFAAGDGDAMHVPPGYGVELRVLALLLALGLVWLVMLALRPAGPEGRGALFLLAALALYPVPGALTVPSPHALRGAHLIPLSALVAGLGAVATADLIRRLLRPHMPRLAALAPVVLATALVVALGIEAIPRYRDYFQTYPTQVTGQFQYGIEPALAYAHAHEAEYDAIWLTGANQPYIYVLFYLRWPPSDLHQHLQVHRDPPNFNEVYGIGKYHFGEPSSTAGLALLKTVRDPQGRPVFELRGGRAPDGQRVLVIARP